MSLDPGIICFKHCSSKAIFCKKVPDICPLCQSFISKYVLEPFRLPNPFAKGKECPATILLRPSRGDFLNDYKVCDDLHIGIVDSKGCILEFDKPGIIRDGYLNWQNCLALKMVPESWADHWDETIEKICNEDKWAAKNYDGDSFNCFTFVLEFLKALKYREADFSDKEDFCRRFVVPKIQDALKFINFYRNLKDAEHFLSN